MTRPVTEQERAGIEAARKRIERAREELAAAERERNLALLHAYNGRANVTELARVAGITRQKVHAIINELGF